MTRKTKTKASTKRVSKKSSAGKNKKDSGWVSLTWEDMDRWAGSRSVSRGRSYQRQGRVKDLTITQKGKLLATVAGGDIYVVQVSLTSKSKSKKRSLSLQADCTCPVGMDCKHAVAAVVEYLDALSDGREIPIAKADDPRIEKMAYCEDRKTPDRMVQKKHEHWDQKIRGHIEGLGEDALVELVWTLTKRYPDIYQEFRERIQLKEGDVDNLVADARSQIQSITSEPGWYNRWEGTGEIPDYAPIRNRFERLMELGYADEVVALGRELIEDGLGQVEESHDEGETADELGSCLPLVCEAVMQSTLSDSDKLLFGIDACLQDGYGIVDEGVDVIFNASWPEQAWSDVADELAKRLDRQQKKMADEHEDNSSYSRDYQRDQLSRWLTDALEHAGREDGLRQIYEREARLTNSYERLVQYLIDEKCYDDAEAWAMEGIEKTCDTLQGIAGNLCEILRDLARKRRQWDIAAGYVAQKFFHSPSVMTFKELAKAATKAKCQDKVCQQAMRFLETGMCPIHIPATKKGKQEKLEIDSTWPLPAPKALIPLLRQSPRHSGPHYNVLLDLAIDNKEPDKILRWYDAMRKSKNQNHRYYVGYGYGYGLQSYPDRVAQAVAASHPGRALEIYENAVQELLPKADPRAYEEIGCYLRLIKPVLKTLHREKEWPKHINHLREEYKRRPRFIEVLDKLDGKTIIQSSRKRKT